MEVIVYSTVATAPGQVIVATDESNTIDSIISSFCIERGIRHQKEYVLRNVKHQLLPNVRKVGICGVQNGDVLYLGVRVASERWIAGCSQWWLLAGVALCIGALGLVAISILKVKGSAPIIDYGIVIDAGSSHSQIYVYKWNADKYNDTALAQQTLSCKAKGGGISSYTGDPKKAGDSLQECLNNAQHNIPKSSYTKTPLFLGATAGMRLLQAANKSASDAVMGAVRDTMKTYPFNFSNNHADILTGKREGAYGWITVNYILDNFGEKKLLSYLGLTTETINRDVVGALDMGGASTQISFYPEEPDNITEEDKSSLLLYGQTYHIYTHSYLCYGLNEATRRYNALLIQNNNYQDTVMDPCRQTGNIVNIDHNTIFEVPCTKQAGFLMQIPPKNSATIYTFKGEWNSSLCIENIERLFSFNTSCSECSFDGARQPPIRGNFVAFSGYYHTVKAFNLTGSFRLDDYRNNYHAHCQQPWKQTNDSFASDICIQGPYIDVLLTKGYKFDKNTWQHITFQEKIRDTDIGWSLGFMLNISNIIPADSPSPPITLPVFVVLVIVFSCFVAIAVGFALYAVSENKDKSKSYRTLTDYGSV